MTGEPAPALVKAPLPALSAENPQQGAGITTPVSELAASGPGASQTAPLTAPRGDALGLPGLGVPGAALLTPGLRGDPVAELGLR